MIQHKLISIAVEGKWDSDGVGIFHNRLLMEIGNEPEWALSILEKLEREKTKCFFEFLFSNPHPAKTIAPSVRNKRDTYPEVVRIAEQALAYALSIEE
jgi:hypothetical protein